MVVIFLYVVVRTISVCKWLSEKMKQENIQMEDKVDSETQNIDIEKQNLANGEHKSLTNGKHTSESLKNGYHNSEPLTNGKRTGKSLIN